MRHVLRLVALALLLLARPAPADGASTRDGVTPFDSFDPSLSASARFIAFDCYSDQLAAGDSNGLQDVLLHDRKTGATELISVTPQGASGNGASFLPVLSANGRFIAFQSEATDLVAADTNGHADIFVRDRKQGATALASVSSDGTQADATCSQPAISGNGRFVAFESAATNLVAGDDNASTDVFVHDRKTGATVRASVDSAGNQANGSSHEPALSATGRFVAFESDAPNLVTGDTNSELDVFVHDLKTGQTTRVSVDSDGVEGNDFSTSPALSSSGRYVAFTSFATNLVAGDLNAAEDIFRHDLLHGQTVRLSVATGGVEAAGDSISARLSASGRLVSFASSAANLVADDTDGVGDVFLADVKHGTTIRVSLGAGGQPQENVGNGALSASGRFAALISYDDTLVAGDTNAAADVFVRDVKQSTTTQASVDSQGNEAGP